MASLSWGQILIRVECPDYYLGLERPKEFEKKNLENFHLYGAYWGGE